ncbi:hypothetical protein GM418_27560 [Maribellus comscasis]|uniref:RCK N-terminal domain-containing protein n=1 Tax=Maribellus comscasis TaxID=2681766 RepID=A0A6I6JVY4_9BACT|nr:hypothetical protein [Maribellus comscasis]QGY47286.1 hypothetical protein GM418_27560 [Maribellus comscasis]
MKNPIRIFDRSFSGSIWKQLLWLLFFLLIAFLFWLGLSYLFLGSNVYIEASFDGGKKLVNSLNKEMNNRFWGIISHLFDPGNLHMADSRTRLFALLVAFSGSALLSGLLISTFSNSLERRIDKIKLGEVNYSFKNHYVIIGYNPMIPALLKQLYKKIQKHRNVDIVLLSSQSVPEVKSKLQSQLPKSIEKNLVLLHGGRDSEEELLRIHVQHAVEIFIVGESEEQSFDSMNVKCFKNIAKVINDKHKKSNHKTSKKIPCHVLFESQSTFTFFQTLFPIKEITDSLSLIPYNFYENWAQMVLANNLAQDFSNDIEQNTIRYKPLDFEQIECKSDKYVHFIVAGFTKMGYAFLTETIRLAHFANDKITKITVIDSDASTEKNYFKSRYPLYELIDDIHIEFINGSLELEEIRKNLSKWANEEKALNTIAICYDNPDKSLTAALNLPVDVYDTETQILVRQEISNSILTIFELKGNNKYRNLKPFGMLNYCFNIDGMRDIKAKAVNHFYNGSFNRKDDSREIDWDVDLDKEWQKLALTDQWSSRYNADSFLFKLRGIGLTPNEICNIEKSDLPMLSSENIEIMAKMEHARWNAERILAGFRPPTMNEIDKAKKLTDEEFETYRSELKKVRVHLCIIPYENLREKYKIIDRMLVKTIPLIFKL